MLRLAGAAILMAFSTPAMAADWYYVSNATDYANISFIDKDSIRDNAEGNIRASMFSVLAVPDEDGAAAYRFEIEINCKARQSRLVAAEIYGEDKVPQGETPMETEWSPVEAGTQGEGVTDYVCSRGKPNVQNPSAGRQLPFDSGKAMLANLAKAGAK